METLIVEKIAALTDLLRVMQCDDNDNSARKGYTNQWCLNVVKRDPQFIIKCFEKQPVLLMNYIHFFLLPPHCASERKQDVICTYDTFLLRPI